MYVDVIIKNNAKFSDNIFTYRISNRIKNKIMIGQILGVKFGISSKPIEAVAVGIKENLPEDISEDKIKEVDLIIEEKPIITEANIKLLFWMRKRYMCTYGDCLSVFYPKGYNFKSKKVVFINKIDEENKLCDEDKIDEGNKLCDGNKIDEGISLEDYKRYFESKGIKIDEKIEGIISTLLDRDFVEYDELIKAYTKTRVEKLKNLGILYISWIAEKKINQKIIEVYSLSKEYTLLEEEIREKKIRLGENQKKIIEYLRITKHAIKKDLETLAGSTSIKSLVKKDILKVDTYLDYRASKLLFNRSDKEISLNENQKQAVDSYINNKKEGNKPILLHGITGSGKTEVYLDIIQREVEAGRDCILLVPEIALTPQIISRVKNRFGDIVGSYNSSLSEGEKHDLFREIRDGHIKVLVGTRSALFMPFNNLGLVIVDEEHDDSYSSDKNPRYSTIDVCRYLNYKEDISIILGSATPSISDYYKTVTGDFLLVELNERANNKSLPDIEVVDMKKEFDRGNFFEISNRLIEEIRATVKRNEQVILFINRRGYSNFVTCKKCGYVEKCINCDISLTYHKSSNKHSCHYCGYEKEIVDITCPSCRNSTLQNIGVGTEKIEDYLNKIFPEFKILRVDKDTTSRKGELERILNKFNNHEADILVGTQILSKGHDFENVTLVGILSADMMLNYPDYRASENTFQLITQVAGRSGRGEKKGRVILQSYDTEHYSIQKAVDYDYKGFYSREIDLRKKFKYEPFNHIIRIVITGDDEKRVEENARRCFSCIEYLMKESDMYNERCLLGPSVCSINRINGRYRWHIIIKNGNIDFNILKAMVKYVCVTQYYKIFNKDVYVSIEQDPKTYL